MFLALTNGVWVNLTLIEACVPGPTPGSWRFFHPRTQRGGRPYGRPPDRPPAHNDDAGCWEGTPVNEQILLDYLGSSLRDPLHNGAKCGRLAATTATPAEEPAS